ncbi:unnamed protein product [Closterium sp. NIES-54]
MTAQALYDTVVARYSSPATTALGRLLLPYLFPKLSAFATVEDLVTHLCTSDARYRAALPTDFLDKNPPPMYITLYFIVTRLPDSLRTVRDHFLALDPTDCAARGTPRTPFFEGCSPSPLAPSYTSSAAVDVLGAEDVGAASAIGKRCSSKGKGGTKVAVAAGVVVGAAVELVEAVEVVAVVGVVAGVGALVVAVVAAVGVAVVVAVGVVAVGLELLSGDVLAVARGSSSSVGVRPCRPSSFTCGKSHTQDRCFSRLDDAWRAEFGDDVKRPRWAELLRSGVAILDLDFDAILAAMYALSVSAEGECYVCVLPDPGIEGAALGASDSALSGTAPAEALHTFTLDLGASRCFFRDSTTLTPLSAPIPVTLADPLGGLVLARSSTVLPCPADAMVTNTTPGGEHVLIYTCTRTGRNLSTFTHRPGSSLYTLATEPPHVAASAQGSASGPVAHLCSSLPPLPPSLAPPCLPCVEGRQRAAPHSSSFPPTISPLHTLHMDVWGPARVSGQGRERYFQLVVDDYMRCTTVFPLRSKGDVPDVLIPWIRAVRLQLSERFREDLPVMHLHSDKGAEFSSDLLRDFLSWGGHPPVVHASGLTAAK